MNAHCERFNPTIQDESVAYREALLLDDLGAFNDRLFEWLHWYNAERPTTASRCVPRSIYPPIGLAIRAGCTGPIQRLDNAVTA